MAEIKLRHRWFKSDRILYFYSSPHGRVEGGVVTLDSERPYQVKRAWRLGYDRDPETGKYIDYNALVRLLKGEPAFLDIDPQVEESTESAEETTDEATDGGRQPTGDDGVRDSAEACAECLPAEGLDSSDSDGSPVRGETD